MAPIPPVLIRLIVNIATQHLTRKLAQSPAFQRGVSRIMHEIDHMPHRIEGKKVPEWRDPDPTQPRSIGEWAERGFKTGEDVGEPHDEPSPWATSASKQPPPPDPRLKLKPKTAVDEQRERREAEEEKRLEEVQTRERQMRELMEKLRSGGK